jgi:hypothetical protein
MTNYKIAREIIAGSIASSTTASMFSPLECVKTRLQVQADPTANVKIIYNRGFMDALRSIVRTDGLLLTWTHGFAGFVLRDFFYSGIRIGCYPTVRSFYAGDNTEKKDVGLLTKIFAGATTGGIGSALANPFDVFRVRMTVEGGVVDTKTGKLITGLKAGQVPRYHSSFHCFRDTLTREGIRGLYRGVEATSTRAAMLSAGQLASYDHSKTLLVKHGWMDEGKPLHLVAAIISGIVAITVCNPADVLKSRLMVQRGGSGEVAVPVNIWAVAKDIWLREGLRGFFRGWGPAYARAGPSFFIQMPIVEGLRSFLGVEAL